MTFERLKLTRGQKEKFRKIRRLEQLQKLDPVEFEQFCGYLYELRGYAAHMTATSGDEGVDLLLKKGNRKEVVQCKRYQGSVGQPTVRDMYGTMLHTNSASSAIVTTGRFTRAAETWAANKPIELVDGHELMSWVNRQRRSGGGSNWIANNAGKITMAALVLLALSIGVFVLQQGIQTLQRRTEVPDLILPTIQATAISEAVVVSTETVAPLPTVTLIPTLSALDGVISAEIIASPIENYTLSTNQSAWDAIPATLATHIVNQQDTWDQSFDVSAAFKFAYDADNLYGYVTVEDDTFVQHLRVQEAYMGDSIELEVDTLGDRAGSAQQDDYQYLISPGDFGDLAAGAFRFRGNGSVVADDWGTQARVVSEQTAGGYVVAFQIPWFDLRMARNPAAGMVLGLSLSVNDNDSPGVGKQELMISHVEGRRWSMPNTWGRLTLGE